jgi:thioredoxin 1
MSYRKLNELGNSEPSSSLPKKENYKTPTIVPEITTKEDKDSLIMNNKVVVVDVYADWCGPCKTSGPLFAELYDKYKDLCKLVKENVDLRLSPTVQVVPTFQIFVEGKLKSQITGANLGEVESVLISSL